MTMSFWRMRRGCPWSAVGWVTRVRLRRLRAASLCAQCSGCISAHASGPGHCRSWPPSSATAPTVFGGLLATETSRGEETRPWWRRQFVELVGSHCACVLAALETCLGCCISLGASPEAQNMGWTGDPVFPPGRPGFSGSVLLQTRTTRGSSRVSRRGRATATHGCSCSRGGGLAPRPPGGTGLVAPLSHPLPVLSFAEALSLCPRGGIQCVHVKSAGAGGCGTGPVSLFPSLCVSVAGHFSTF